MIEPDDCTSLHCSPPNKHCPECSHAIFYGEVVSKGRVHKFEFSPQFGVQFLTKKGDARAMQPAEKNPIWDEFEKWQKDKFKNVK